MNKPKFIQIILLVPIIAVALSSCSNNGGVTTPSQQASTMSMMAANNGSGSNSTLVLTHAKFLIEFIKLEVSRGHDDADVKEGPFVADVSLNTPPAPVQLNNIPAGTFNEIHFKIHKHMPNETVIDPDFGLAGEVGFSGIITGTYNGVPFVYKTAITTNQEIDMDPPLVVMPGNTTVNVTLIVDPAVWFISNGTILNPLDPVNAEIIDHNIKESFREAFRDDDEDGHPDHEHGG
jgi:hypothetical protein